MKKERKSVENGFLFRRARKQMNNNKLKPCSSICFIRTRFYVERIGSGTCESKIEIRCCCFLLADGGQADDEPVKVIATSAL